MQGLDLVYPVEFLHDHCGRRTTTVADGSHTVLTRL